MRNYKHLLGFLFSSFLLVLLIFSIQKKDSNILLKGTYFSDVNFQNKCELDMNKLSLKFITNQEMASHIGGCTGGGTCKDLAHVCPSGCVHLSAKQCQGTVGNCQNTGYSPACRCDEGYAYVQGCF